MSYMWYLKMWRNMFGKLCWETYWWIYVERYVEGYLLRDMLRDLCWEICWRIFVERYVERFMLRFVEKYFVDGFLLRDDVGHVVEIIPQVSRIVIQETCCRMIWLVVVAWCSHPLSKSKTIRFQVVQPLLSGPVGIIMAMQALDSFSFTLIYYVKTYGIRTAVM